MVNATHSFQGEVNLTFYNLGGGLVHVSFAVGSEWDKKKEYPHSDTGLWKWKGKAPAQQICYQEIIMK